MSLWIYSKEGDTHMLTRDEWSLTYSPKAGTKWFSFKLLPCVHDGMEYHPFALGIASGPKWVTDVNARVAWAIKTAMRNGNQVEIPWDNVSAPVPVEVPTKAATVLTTINAGVLAELSASIDSL